MGILNHDNITTQQGLSVKDTYVSIGKNEIRIKKTDAPSYSIEFGYTSYVSQDAKLNGKYPIAHQLLNYDEKSVPIDVYDYCYSKLKLVFSNYSDC
jgi:hypothetical protein